MNVYTRIQVSQKVIIIGMKDIVYSFDIILTGSPPQDNIGHQNSDHFNHWQKNGKKVSTASRVFLKLQRAVLPTCSCLEVNQLS